MILGQARWSVRNSIRTITLLFTVVTCAFTTPSAHAQFGFGAFRGGVVGGVSVDAEGAVRTASVEERSQWLAELHQQANNPIGDLAEKTDLRMISLSKLQSVIRAAMDEERSLPDEVVYLAGLQRVEYVFVYPQRQDIVLAGPAEPWVVREDASVVGRFSGRPVLQLEDLITALRSVDQARQQPISVSIEPTAEGTLQLREVLAQLRRAPGTNPARFEPQMRDAFGPQQVKLTTVATDSRMASTLVAADYRMKRLAMGLEESLVAGLTSYMEMIRDQASIKLQPRWWMACDYDAIRHSPDMLAWKLEGTGIETLTEDEYVTQSGERRGTGESNKLASRWAENFTSKFDELCSVYPAFGDLRNVIDLNIVATIVRGHELDRQADCDLSLLCGSDRSLETPRWETPRTIAPEFSFIRGRNGWVVSASGGVEVNPFRVVGLDAREDARLTPRPVASNQDGETHWWWD